MERCQLQFFAPHKHSRFISPRDQMSCLRTFPPNSRAPAIVAPPVTPMFVVECLFHRSAGSPEIDQAAITTCRSQCGHADISQVRGILSLVRIDSRSAASRKLHGTDSGTPLLPVGRNPRVDRTEPFTEATFARLSRMRSQHRAVAFPPLSRLRYLRLRSVAICI
jgi:hypothetical protein